MKKEEKEKLIEIYEKAKEYKHPYAYFYSNNRELNNPTQFNLEEFQDLIDLVNIHPFKKVFYKITSKNKFIWVDTIS